MSNYYIGVDENGQAYICHANEAGAGAAGGGKAPSAFGRRVHKYLMKIGEGAKARYAYTQEQVDALMGRGKRAVRKAIGLDARDRRDAAKKRFSMTKVGAPNRKAHREQMMDAQDEYDRTLLGRAESVGRKLKRRAKSARDSISKRASTTLGSIRDRARDIAGYDERETRDQLWEAMRNPNNKKNPATKAMTESAYRSAQSAYARTPLGMLEAYRARKKVKKSTHSK